MSLTHILLHTRTRNLVFELKRAEVRILVQKLNCNWAQINLLRLVNMGLKGVMSYYCCLAKMTLANLCLHSEL